MRGNALLAASFFALSLPLRAAEPVPMDWPEVVGNLAKVRTQALACVGLLKSTHDNAAIQNAKPMYASAKANIDGVIAGLMTALAAGGKPESLPMIRTNLETSGASLREICAAAVKTRAVNPHAKGVWDDLAAGVMKGAMEPIINAIADAIAVLWNEHEKRNELEFETTETQLEAAKWPEFAAIHEQ